MEPPKRALERLSGPPLFPEPGSRRSTRFNCCGSSGWIRQVSALGVPSASCATAVPGDPILATPFFEGEVEPLCINGRVPHNLADRVRVLKPIPALFGHGCLVR